PPPRCTLFPYTTLFRSSMGEDRQAGSVARSGCGDLAGGFDAGSYSSQARPRSPIKVVEVDVLIQSFDKIFDAEMGVSLEHSKGLDRKSTRLNSSHDQIS